jgi:hypothetical protein
MSNALEISEHPQESPQQGRSLGEAIAAAYKESGYGELEGLDIHTDGNRVVISGKVSSFFVRQKAECIGLHLAGLGNLESHVQVETANASSGDDA